MKDVAIAVDLGGSTLRVGLVDRQGNVLRSERQRLAQMDVETVLSVTTQLVQKFDATGDVPIGMGLAAVLWLRTGVIAVAPNLGWRDVPIAALLHKRLGRRVRLCNDLDAITYGEWVAGAGQGHQNVLCVFVGTGVGMGCIVQGQLLEGSQGLATELGHVKIESVTEGRLCGCGSRGCLEAYTGGRHLPELLMENQRAGWVSNLRDNVDAVAIDKSARDNEPASLKLWEQVSERLARAIGGMVTIFNPSCLILGGGVLSNAPYLLGMVQSQLGAYAHRDHLHDLTIVQTKLGDSAGIVGAGMLAHHQTNF